MSFDTAIRLLKSYVYRRGIDYHLESFKALLAKLGHVHLDLAPVIHVAGTNGKGSTIAFLRSALQENGYIVGCYTSPHLLSYCERITLGDSCMSEHDFSAYFQRVHSLADTQTEFELLTAMSFLYFYDKKPDIILIETGLGGRLDASNVLYPILCLITSIGYDHQAILGHSLEAISREKAGIIKENTPVITTCYQDKQALSVISQRAKELHAPLILADLAPLAADFMLQGEFQRINLGLARSALAYLAKHLHLEPQHIDQGLKRATHWGRFTQMVHGSHRLIIDAAHNAMAMQALCQSLSPEFRQEVVLGLLKTKDAVAILTVLSSFFSTIHYCDFDPGLSWSITEISRIVTQHHLPLQIISVPLERLFTHVHKPVLVTGSIHFLGRLKGGELAKK